MSAADVTAYIEAQPGPGLDQPLPKALLTKSIKARLAEVAKNAGS